MHDTHVRALPEEQDPDGSGEQFVGKAGIRFERYMRS